MKPAEKIERTRVAKLTEICYMMIKKTIPFKKFEDLANMEKKHKLIGVGADGANVNLGSKKGLVKLIQEEVPWLIGVHCLKHRLELNVRDAFKKTHIENVGSGIMDLYYLYQNSPKKLRELRELAYVLEQQVRKSKKSHGTRWVQHKLEASQILIKGYGTICTHPEA